MQLDVAILGASGYGGGELMRWLSQHPNVASIHGTSRSAAGRPFYDAHPNLRGMVEGKFVSAIPWHDLAKSEQPVVFSALPRGKLANTLHEIERKCSAAGVTDQLLLIDLSADFRDGSHGFVYGLPEWNRGLISKARRIASAGCFATALQLALLPFRGVDIGFIAATGITGSSGSGAAVQETTHHPTRAGDFRAYKVLEHQHTAEVERAMRACDIRGHLAFVPHSGPFVRGIFVTVQFALPKKFNLEERLGETFSKEPFVRLVEGSPRVAAVAGSNFGDISFAIANGSGAIMVALDNLGKGMAGQAVQSMNIALGLPEVTALRQPSRFP